MILYAFMMIYFCKSIYVKQNILDSLKFYFFFIYLIRIHEMINNIYIDPINVTLY